MSIIALILAFVPQHTPTTQPVSSTDGRIAESLFERLASLDEHERRTAALSLADVLPLESTLLIDRLSSPDRADRLRAIEAARMFTKHQARLVPALAPLLDSSDADERAWCAWALGGLTPSSLPQLFTALTHDDPAVRIAAAEGIEKSMWPFWNVSLRSIIGGFPPWRRSDPSSQPEVESWEIVRTQYIGALARGLSDSEELVRVFVVMSIWKLGAEARSAQGELRIALHGSSPAVRFWVRQALERTQDSPRALLTRIASQWEANGPPAGLTEKDASTDLRDFDAPDAWTRDNWGQAHPPVVDRRWMATRRLIRWWLPCLIALEASPNVWVAAGAKAVLVRMEYNVQSHITRVLGLMDDEYGPGQVARSLVELGPAVVPSVTWDFLRCPRFPIGLISHECLAYVLVSLGEDGLATLAMGLEQWRDEPRAWGSQGLVKAGPAALPALPAVISAWRNGSAYQQPPGYDRFWDVPTRQHFYNGIFDIPGTLGPAHARAFASLGPAALPTLIAALNDRHASVRSRAAHALQGFGSSASCALDALSQCLSDSDPSVRGAAAYAVALIATTDLPLKQRALEIVEEERAK